MMLCDVYGRGLIAKAICATPEVSKAYAERFGLQTHAIKAGSCGTADIDVASGADSFLLLHCQTLSPYRGWSRSS